MKYRHVAWIVGLFVVAASMAPPQAIAADPECAPFHIRLDPSIWNTSRSPIGATALGQTFLANDTLITKITVWRPANTPSVWGAHLYVTGTNVSGRPDVQQILLDGPTVIVHDSSPPGSIIEMPFVLDPPVRLPRPGVYAFFLQPEGCTPGAVWMILANDADPYPYGLYWITGRVDNPPCHLRAVDGGSNNTDLLFDIQFCSTAATTVRTGPWGRLKVIYR
jgi:hypothetical protein